MFEQPDTTSTMHGYDQKRCPLSFAQGRVLYHAERLFRSAGGRGVLAHGHYVLDCARAGLGAMVDQYTDAQCVQALRLIEQAARAERLHLFRPVETGWADFAPGGRFAKRPATC